MRIGPKPLALQNLNATANNKLILVHGYCAASNEFPIGQFTNAVQFKDFKASKSNDQFTLQILKFANDLGLTSFGIVGHSQGGLAAVHIHTYYHSSMDNANGGRLIQSVGSPYKGTGLAGSLAGIGPIFGVGCGSNSDLTYDGAGRWAAAIPTTHAAKAFYYTTQYGTKGYCVWGANLVLYAPNDGTTEIKYASLVGANNAGTKVDWCHTTDMIYPNQCTDAGRNSEMNNAASR